MPMYQYQCDNCSREFDHLASFATATENLLCERCGGVARRIFGAAQVRTSNTFLKGLPLGGAQFGPANREFYLRAAREAGVSTDGKVYDGRIAAFPADPEAWVTGPDDIRAVLEKRNWGCDGDMTVKCEPTPPAEDVKLADDIVEGLVEKRLEEQFGEDFEQVSGAAVSHAIEDVMNTHAAPY